jgi:hypothetical protein
MRSRSTVTAALALAAATILAVAACGSTVSGSAAVNTAAAASIESSTTASTESTTSTESTDSSRATSEAPTPTALPTDLSELTALLSGLPTDLSLPSDLSIPSDLGDLNIPGYNPECVTVALAYGSILLATYPALLGGDGAFDATQLQKAISDLSGQVPPEIAGDIQALGEVAAEANGKTLTEVGQLFDSDKFKTASDHIEAWTNTNCGG